LRVIIILIISITLSGCDKIHEYTKPYKTDKTFQYKEHSFSYDKTVQTLGLKIVLSYKSNNYCYYNIKMEKNVKNIKQNKHIYIRFTDKNDMILYEVSPGYTTNDQEEETDLGVINRGKFEIDEGIFKDIKKYEVYLFNRY